jgi:hypothetical protein
LLSSPVFCQEYADYAHRLFVQFVELVDKIYGSEFLVCNVHCLMHLAEDVKPKKAIAAKLTSDLSASMTSDLCTHHDRCTMVETDQDEEHVGLANSTTQRRPQSAVLHLDSTCNTAGLCTTAPPVPQGPE